MLQRDLHQSLRARALASHARIAELARPLDHEYLFRRPLDGGWSVGVVLEHLCVSAEAYGPLLLGLLRRARPDASAPLREWAPTFFGKLLARSLEAPRKLPTPKRVRPGASPRGGVVELFLAQQLAFVARLDDAARFDWRALKLTSPLVPRIVRPLATMNLGDAFHVEVVHVERHARQIERVIAATR
ncbi:MAG: DinB family protein [Gemmatimonadaceae bacterium]